MKNKKTFSQAIVDFWNKLLNPKFGVAIILFYVIALLIITATIILVCLGFSTNVLAYVLYVIAFLCLGYFGYTVWFFAPRVKERIFKCLKKYKITNNILENYGYRTLIFSIIQSIINIIYTVFMIIIAILSGMVWNYSLAVYYTLLSAMRCGILISKKRNVNSNELQAKSVLQSCGISFIVTTFILSGIILLTVKDGMTFEYAGLMIYTVSTYTFYKLTVSTINFIKVGKHADFYVKSLRYVNVVDALVSLLTLQTALLTAFGNNTEYGLFNAITGALVCSAIIALGIYAIALSNKHKRELKENSSNER